MSIPQRNTTEDSVVLFNCNNWQSILQLLNHYITRSKIFSVVLFNCNTWQLILQLEGTLVKTLFNCKLVILEKLIESLLFAEHTMVTGQGFHLTSGWPTLTFV